MPEVSEGRGKTHNENPPPQKTHPGADKNEGLAAGGFYPTTPLRIPEAA